MFFQKSRINSHSHSSILKFYPDSGLLLFSMLFYLLFLIPKMEISSCTNLMDGWIDGLSIADDDIPLNQISRKKLLYIFFLPSPRLQMHPK